MLAFIIISLMASVLAAPQGYNYQQQSNVFQLPGIPQIPVVTSSAPSSAATSVIGSSAQKGHSFLQQTFQAPNIQHSTQGTGSAYNSNNVQPPRPQPPQQNVGLNILPANFDVSQRPLQQPQYQPTYQHGVSPMVTKDIYVHVAPEEPEERYAQPQYSAAPPRKHYRIVFIKAPAPSASKAALRVKQAPTEEKTIIYVLTKKPDPLELQAAIEEAAPKPISKPEVYFIKYKTQEEAQHAQRTIQAQYDQLGGTTQISDEGVAPVTSVIGALDQPHKAIGIGVGGGVISSGSFSVSGAGGAISASNIGGASQYLPPIART